MASDTDKDNLRTAATYVNNLLLARGLLRNGAPIDFVGFGKAKGDEGNKENRGSSATTTAQILNVIHDLILRRDRDQAHLESLSTTLSSLRSDASRHQQELERSRKETEAAQRQATLRDTEARNATRAARSAEASARKLREEVQRVKNVVVQVRAQSDKDLRKKDLEFHRLKQKGAGVQTGGTHAIVDGKFGQAHRVKIPESLQDSVLNAESKEFLAELSKSLSDENDSLISLVQGTLIGLRELMGMEHNQPAGLKVEFADDPDGVSFRQLEVGLGVVLGSLRDLLTSPAFAPIEEVHVREEEIQRLREGWIMMEDRWREAVAMMQGWRRKMSGGESIDMAELKRGLRLGEGVQKLASSPLRHLSGNLSPSPAGSHSRSPSPGLPGTASDSDSLDDVQHNKDQDDKLLRDLGSLDISPAETRGREETTRDLTVKVNGNVDMRRARKVPGFMKPTSAATNRQGTKAPAKAPKRAAQNKLPVLTVEQKLKLAEEEARRVSLSTPPSSPLQLNAAPSDLEDDEPPKAGIRRSKITGRPRRRQSTLSPEELDVLLGHSTNSADTETF